MNIKNYKKQINRCKRARKAAGNVSDNDVTLYCAVFKFYRRPASVMKAIKGTFKILKIKAYSVKPPEASCNGLLHVPVYFDIKIDDQRLQRACNSACSDKNNVVTIEPIQKTYEMNLQALSNYDAGYESNHKRDQKFGLSESDLEALKDFRCITTAAYRKRYSKKTVIEIEECRRPAATITISGGCMDYVEIKFHGIADETFSYLLRYCDMFLKSVNKRKQKNYALENDYSEYGTPNGYTIWNLRDLFFQVYPEIAIIFIRNKNKKVKVNFQNLISHQKLKAIAA